MVAESVRGTLHGLPSNVDLSFFEGRRLVQVCVGLHELIINFDNRVAITAECRIAVSVQDEALRQFDDPTLAAVELFRILQRIVESVEGRNDGELILRFECGSSVHLYDDATHYESYMIRNGEELIVV